MEGGARLASRRLVGYAIVLLGCSTLPYWWHVRGAAAVYEGDVDFQRRLGKGVAAWASPGLRGDDFDTGSWQFDGEWLFGSYLMAGLGLGQAAIIHPELRAANLPLMEICVRHILSPEVRAFDRRSWAGEDPIESLEWDDGGDHAAYLGYFNILLGMHRLLDPESPFAEELARATTARSTHGEN